MAAATDTVVGIQKQTDANIHENQQFRTNVTQESQSQYPDDKVSVYFVYNSLK